MIPGFLHAGSGRGGARAAAQEAPRTQVSGTLLAQEMSAAAAAGAGPGGGRGRFRLAPLRQIFRSSRGAMHGSGGVQLPGDHVPLRSPSELDEP